jgi:NADH:ubiquinone reductase (H+-translocating)
MGTHGTEARVVIIGGGFGGVHTARALSRLMGDAAEVVLVSPVNYMLYTPLLPEVAAGILQPRNIGVPLRRTMRQVRILVGEATHVDVEAKIVSVQPPEGPERHVTWDRLVLAPGSISRMFPIPGLAEHAYGFKNLAEAVHIRNHVIRQLEVADAAEDIAERRCRCTFLTVGAGYAGTELVAELEDMVRRALRNYPRLRPADVRFLLIDVAPAVLPELGEELGERALRILRRRGVDVRLRTTVEEAGEDWVKLSDGELISTRTFVWTAGVTPDPLIAKTGLPTNQQGRLVCDEYTRVEGRDDVFSIGDAAAIPDPSNPDRPTPPTAQFAVRQGKTCARNVAASLGVGAPSAFTFKGLGLLVGLARGQAVAKVLGRSLTGFPAYAITRGYHLLALPTLGRKLRVANDWLLAAGGPPDIAELGTLGHAGPLATER